MKKIVIGAFLLVTVLLTANELIFKNRQTISDKIDEAVVVSMYNDKALFLSAIKQNPATDVVTGVSGITVPHHLLAIDLIARVFAKIKINEYQRVILVSPDHFGACPVNICYSASDFLTVFGKLDGVKRVELPVSSSVANLSDYLYREHGVQAILPFIKYYFPKTEVLVVTFNYSSKKNEVDEFSENIKPLLNKNTLIVQSTDFSHYLTAEQASVKDEQTIKIISEDNVNEIFNLSQPDNIDSVAAQYFQSKIQRQVYGASLTIPEHKNSQDYTTNYVTSTTSYITQIYKK